MIEFVLELYLQAQCQHSAEQAANNCTQHLHDWHVVYLCNMQHGKATASDCSALLAEKFKQSTGARRMAIPSAAGGHAGRLKGTPSPSAPLEWRRQTQRTLHAQQQSQHRLDSRSKADEASATTGKPQGYCAGPCIWRPLEVPQSHPMSSWSSARGPSKCAGVRCQSLAVT